MNMKQSSSRKLEREVSGGQHSLVCEGSYRAACHVVIGNTYRRFFGVKTDINNDNKVEDSTRNDNEPTPAPYCIFLPP